MKKIRQVFSVLMVVSMLMLPMVPLLAGAATPNPSPASPGYMVLPFHLSGSYAATSTGAIKFNMPFPATLIAVQCSCKSSTGTAPTIDVKLGGTSVLSSAITMTTGGTVYEGTISTSAIPDEGVITVDLTVGTTAVDTTVILVMKRK